MTTFAISAEWLQFVAKFAVALVVGLGAIRLLLWCVDCAVRADRRRAADESWVTIRTAPRRVAEVDLLDD
ncbi:MAG: hypothetical protein AB7S70_02525 [Hyphomicrobium sp.]|uniref:hypothetical protein n=1 Tax=Hyphomicrobium sp. TaxID=82 RepID=UPI003D09EFA4